MLALTSPIRWRTLCRRPSRTDWCIAISTGESDAFCARVKRSPSSDRIRSREIGASGRGRGESHDSLGAIRRHSTLRESRTTGGGNVDVRSDIYSWELPFGLCSRHDPFPRLHGQVMSQHLSRSLLSKSSPLRPSGDVARRLLEKDPRARPQSPTELRREIEECLGQLGPKIGSCREPALAEDEQNSRPARSIVRTAGSQVSGRRNGRSALSLASKRSATAMRPGFRGARH